MMTNPQVLPITSHTATSLESLRSLPFVHTTVPKDAALVRSIFVHKERFSLYGNSWMYLTQAADSRPLGSQFGYHFYDGERFAAIGFYRRPFPGASTWHFHVVRPAGDWSQKDIESLCARLREISGSHVYLKKLSEQQRQAWKGDRFRPIEDMPWHPLAPAEDDTYPEIVVDLSRTLRLLERDAGDNELRRKFRRAESEYGASCRRLAYSPMLGLRAWRVVQGFFDGPRELSTEENFRNMLESPPAGKLDTDYFGALYEIEGEPVALFLADTVGPGVAGVYANMTSSRRWRMLSEYLLLREFRNMADTGMRLVNLGGSETEGLHNFKLKFRPVDQVQMHWLIYD